MKAKKNKAYWASRIILFSICIGLISLSIVDFSKENTQRVEGQLNTSLENNTKYLKSNIQSKADDILSTLKAYSIFVGSFDNIYDHQVLETLDKAGEKNMFINMSIDNLEGYAKDTGGYEYNVADREYFQKAIRGEEVVSAVLVSRREEKSCVVYAVPIYNKQDEIVGVLHSSILLDTFNEYFDTEGLESQGHTIITDLEGNIISNGGLDLEKVDAFNDEQKDLLFNKGEGHVVVEIEGKTQHVYYTYDPITKWVIFSSVNDQIIDAKVAKSNQIVVVLVIRLVVIISLLGYVMLYWDRQKNKQIKKQMEDMDMILKNSPGGVICYEKKHSRLTLSFISDGACEIFGLSHQEAVSELKRGYRQYLVAKENADALSLSQETILEAAFYRIADKEGTVKWIYDNRQSILDADRELIYVTLMDITTMMDLQDEVKSGEQRLRMVMEGTNLMFFDYDIENDTALISNGMKEFMGLSGDIDEFKEHFIFKDKENVSKIDNECLVAFLKDNGHTFSVDEELTTVNDTKKWVHIKGRITLDKAQKPRNIMGVLVDINDMKKEKEKLEEQTMMDPLTGIYNKAGAETLIREKLNTIEPGYSHVLFAIDVDDFKLVNDTYGHLEGDIVLSQLAFKFMKTFRKNDIVGRIGGDEFVVLMCDVHEDHETIIEEKAKQLIQEVDALKDIDNKMGVSCSIGIAKCPRDGTTYEELFNKADQSLYDMKRDGKSSYRFYQEKK